MLHTMYTRIASENLLFVPNSVSFTMFGHCKTCIQIFVSLLPRLLVGVLSSTGCHRNGMFVGALNVRRSCGLQSL